MSERWFPDAMPSPAVNELTRPFFEACLQHQLTVQQCTACHSFRHPPRPICSSCHATGSQWTDVSGTGVIYTHAVIHQPLHPALRDHIPYVVVVVTLDGTDGARLASNLVGEGAAEQVSVGARVEVVWEDMSPDLTLPRFVLSGAG